MPDSRWTRLWPPQEIDELILCSCLHIYSFAINTQVVVEFDHPVQCLSYSEHNYLVFSQEAYGQPSIATKHTARDQLFILPRLPVKYWIQSRQTTWDILFSLFPPASDIRARRHAGSDRYTNENTLYSLGFRLGPHRVCNILKFYWYRTRLPSRAVGGGEGGEADGGGAGIEYVSALFELRRLLKPVPLVTLP